MSLTVAVLGTGAMGAPMARNLLRAGHAVRVWNRTAEKAEALVDDGAVACSTPAEAAAGADVLVTMLADGLNVAEAVDGVLRAGLAWLQMSTVGVEWTRRLAERAAEAGTVFVDAPVLGSTDRAATGELLVLSAGAEDERADAVFDAVGARTLRLGEVGNGTRVKLVLNYWVLGTTALTAETIALADALGVGGERFLDLIRGTFTDSPYAQLKGAKMVARDHVPFFGLALGRKDVELALEAAEGVGLDLALGRAVSGEMASAIADGHGSDDISGVIEALRS